MGIRIGAKVPNSGPLPAAIGIVEMARRAEAAGFDSVWSSDHVVQPRRIESRYPFAKDGRATWATDLPWFDAVVAMSTMAAVTSSAEIGVAVLVLPLRHPVVFAKQIASIDALSHGRVVLGVGAGWLAEEFAALGVPFETRGRRLDEWLQLLASCWTGSPAAFDGEHYQLPPDVVCEPTPVRRPPILVGGHTAAALRRAGTRGDGWLGQQSADQLDPDEVSSARRELVAGARAAGREPDMLRIVLRIVASAEQPAAVAAALPALERAGVNDVIVDLPWDREDGAGRVHDLLRSAVAG